MNQRGDVVTDTEAGAMGCKIYQANAAYENEGGATHQGTQAAARN